MSGSRDWVGMLGMPAAAGGIAVCFSHPLELTKVRLQLDNERAAAGTPRVYKGWLDCVGQNFKKDGVRGLQRGLSLGITREVCFNAVRIGLLEPVLEGVHAAAVTIGWASQEASPGSSERLAAGLTCGALGGMCVNPIEVLKTRFQAFGGLTGFQHQSAAANPVSALLDLFRTEGLSGAFRGVATSTLRGMLGPGSQIYAYGEIKSWAVSRGASANSSATHVACALASASVSVLCVNPVDVTRTRCVSRTPTQPAPFAPLCCLRPNPSFGTRRRRLKLLRSASSNPILAACTTRRRDATRAAWTRPWLSCRQRARWRFTRGA